MNREELIEKIAIKMAEYAHNQPWVAISWQEQGIAISQARDIISLIEPEIRADTLDKVEAFYLNSQYGKECSNCIYMQDCHDIIFSKGCQAWQQFRKGE